MYHLNRPVRVIYLLFLEFAVWSSSSCPPPLHAHKFSAPRQQSGTLRAVPPLSTALPPSSPALLCLCARARHFASFYSRGRVCSGNRGSRAWHFALYRANKSWHPVDITGSHAWDGTRRVRTVDWSFLTYLFLSEGQGSLDLMSPV